MASTAAAQIAGSDILTYKGADREQRLIEGATREKEVVHYSAMIVNQALRPLTAAFQKKMRGPWSIASSPASTRSRSPSSRMIP